jgi:signal transduction histidine kinase/DNA-binding response OmpR family regulator/ligand-binding sensor domain-containing protein
LHFYTTLIFSLLLSCISWQLSAQEYVVNVQEFGMEEGLANRRVDEIFKDKDGFLWIATANNLQRYDGYEFKSYSLEGVKKKIQWITDIGQHSDDWIWFITTNQTGSGFEDLYFLNPLTEDIIDKEERLGIIVAQQLDSLTNINEYNHYKHKEHIYFGAKNHILVLNFKTGIRKINVPIAQSSPIKIELIDSKNNFWIYDHKKPLIKKLSPTGELINTIRINTTFVSKEDRSLIFYRKYVFEWKENIYISDVLDSTNPEHNNVYRVDSSGEHQLTFEAPKGYFPFGLLDGYIWYISPSSWKIFDISGALIFEIKRANHGKQLFKAMNPTTFLIDNTDKIFLGSSFGFNIIDAKKSPFTKYFSNDKDNQAPIVNESRGIYAENDSVLINFETGGLVLFQKNTPANYKLISTKSINTPNDSASIPYTGRPIIRDSKNNFWISNHKYLSKWSPDLLKEEKIFLGIDSTKIFHHSWSVYEDLDGCIWSGNIHALVKSCPKERTESVFPYEELGFNLEETLYLYQILPHEESEQLLWLCSKDGLFVFDKEKGILQSHYHIGGQEQYQLPATDIFCMYTDKEENRWLGTRSGLVYWNPTTGEKRLFNRNDGLSNNVIYAVYEDDYNRLWLSSDYGIMSFHKETFDVQTYLKKDGIAQLEFNRISHFQDEAGTIYFGGINGLTSFHPSDFIEKEKNPAPMVISDFEIFDGKTEKVIHKLSEITETQTINFHPSDQFFRLKFVLPSLSDKSKTLYAWKIKGVFDDWNYQKENTLQFGALPYGNHELHIKGQTAGSGWSPHELLLKIKVLKPFYLQTWFIASCILALGMSIFLFNKRRINLLKERQKQLEDKIENATAQIQQQNEELKSLDKVKSNFFANISHELRTPLTLILGPLSYVLDKSDEWKKEDVLQQLRVMQRNGKSLLQLIEEILDLSKLEAKKMNLEEEGTSVRQFFEHILNLFEPQFQSQKLNYELVFNLKDPDLHMLLDRKKIEKVLNNYLSNAIKFTPSGDKITLSVSETKTELKIQVSDTGKGVHPNDLPYIFERFYQSKQAEQKLYGGTGIGLALVNEFADLMGGKAYAESQLGIGSQFYFDLPKKSVSVNSMTPKTIVAISKEEFEEKLIANIGTDFTILVVEDNEDMRNFVCQLLETRYKNILQAKNGAEGLKLLRKHGLDIRLVISDVMMPEVDGLTMLKELKSNPEWSGIPVIMLTALSAERDKMAALTIGVDDYLTKPFSVTELLARVQNLLYNYHQREAWQKSPEYLVMQQLDQANVVESPSSVQDKKWVNEIEETIKSSFSAGILDIAALAVMANLSPRQFSRKLNTITGLSPARFIKEVQLQIARKELENGTVLSIKEVSYKIGIESPSTFSKVFKARFGKSPSEYIKKRV